MVVVREREEKGGEKALDWQEQGSAQQNRASIKDVLAREACTEGQGVQ